MAKLTTAQREALAIMARGRDGKGAMRALDTYKPTQKLVELGLAKRVPIRGALTTSLFVITDAGRAALAEKEG